MAVIYASKDCALHTAKEFFRGTILVNRYCGGFLIQDLCFFQTN